ncbi:unnamed protein product [Vitrella brassicaformis CCMP3155]|uniref:Protein-serine/threonine kinase n=2 Tax=Vitrella brassicaformis TaxID=1169539 RepID=A0A0G4GD85_VITBC|nr:unnamed protein product [Vitrella brassicaformis CCMP3155]|eukprot:CEM26965.1 unnamed protein product [Vitrella brassicaformis CCMP3155]
MQRNPSQNMVYHDLGIKAAQSLVTIKPRTFIELGEQSLKATREFLSDQLAVKFARRLDLFETLPALMPYIDRGLLGSVRQDYLDWFQRIRDPAVAKEPDNFAATLDFLRHRHHDAVSRTVWGVREILRKNGERLRSGDSDVEAYAAEEQLQHFLTDLFKKYIRFELVMNHYLLARQSGDSTAILNKGSLRDTIGIALDNSTGLCRTRRGFSPNVDVQTSTPAVLTTPTPHFRRPIHYVTQELLKNALRATVESAKYSGNGQASYPSVRLECDATAEGGYMVRVTDRGDGINKEAMDKVWSFLYTTAEFPPDLTYETWKREPKLAGFGCGLPISRLYANFLGGDLTLESTEGKGTQATLTLPPLVIR